MTTDCQYYTLMLVNEDHFIVKFSRWSSVAKASDCNKENETEVPRNRSVEEPERRDTQLHSTLHTYSDLYEIMISTVKAQLNNILFARLNLNQPSSYTLLLHATSDWFLTSSLLKVLYLNLKDNCHNDFILLYTLLSLSSSGYLDPLSSKEKNMKDHSLQEDATEPLR